MDDVNQRQKFSVVYGVMKGESDRGCVLVAASLIEWQMGELLTKEFLARHEPNNAEELGNLKEQIRVMLDATNEKSILGAAAARGRMCRLLNLIDEDVHRLMKAFFVFRNQHFAHAHHEVRLEDGSIKRALDKLTELIPSDFVLSTLFPGLSPERDQFAKIVVVLYASLTVRRIQTDQTESQPSSS